jgi:hypothetical protein
VRWGDMVDELRGTLVLGKGEWRVVLDWMMDGGRVCEER